MKRNSTIQHGSKNGLTQSDNTELQSIKISTDKKLLLQILKYSYKWTFGVGPFLNEELISLNGCIKW